MKTLVNFWSCLAQFFLECEIFQTKIQKIETHILCSVNIILRKSYRLLDNVEEYCTAGQAPDDR
jgi:hypothetical protein